MPRTPEEVFAEIAAWPLAERLRLAERIVAEAARLAQRAAASRPARGGEKQPSGAANQPPGTADPSGAARRAIPGASAAAALSRSSSPPSAAPPTAAGPRRLVMVDGSNFLGSVSGFDLTSDASRDELILRLQEFARDHPAFRVIAYFDGQKTTVRRAGGVEVRFTPRERPADFFILEALRGLTEEERLHALLVTADRELGESARKLGTKVEAPASFHRRLPGTRRPAMGDRGLSAAEVADWEEYFNRPPDQGGSRG